MRILWVGAWSVYRRGFYNDVSSPIARDQDTATALADLGHTVDVLGAPGSDETIGDVHRCRVLTPDVLQIAAYDAVVLVPEFGYWHVRDRAPSQLEALRKHPNVLVWADQWLPDGQDVDFARIYATTSTKAAAVYHTRYLDRKHVRLSWAVTRFPAAPSPFKLDTPRVVFCGHLEDRTIALLNKLAEQPRRWSLWIAGCWTPPEGGYRGFVEEERQRLFHPTIGFMTDIAGTPSGGMIGPLLYGAAAPFYQHATVGLCFAREATTRACVTSKLYDYLGAGLPTVVEQYCLNGDDVPELDAGEIVPYNDADAMGEAIVRQIAATTPKRQAQIQIRAIERFGIWADRAREIAALLEV